MKVTKDSATSKFSTIRPFLCLPTAFCKLHSLGRFFRIFFLCTILLVIIFMIVLNVGAEMEQYQVNKLPGTISYYQTSHVCGLQVSNNNTTTRNDTNVTTDSSAVVIKTYETEEEARSLSTKDNEMTIAHCGDCGACSNPHDISIYDETKSTLFGSSLKCAKRGFLGGRQASSECMRDDVGFTEDCNTCWIDNIMCDFQNCVFICLRHSLFGNIKQQTKDGESQPLNPCTQCDERRCGPAFVECSGANRRRSGILSDIERDLDREVCHAVDQAWWNDPSIQRAYARSHMQESKTEAKKTKQQKPQQALRGHN